MAKLLVLGIIAVVLLAYAKENQVLERAGVLGSCAVIGSPSGDPGQWWRCREGVLTGFPDLARFPCDRISKVEGDEVWRCSRPLDEPPTSL